MDHCHHGGMMQRTAEADMASEKSETFPVLRSAAENCTMPYMAEVPCDVEPPSGMAATCDCGSNKYPNDKGRCPDCGCKR